MRKGVNMKISDILMLALLVISFLIAWYFYPALPDQIASHWNVHGEVDGYLSKFLALFLTPFALVSLSAIFLLIPRIDPLKDNIAKFRRYYDGFFILFFVFLIFLQLYIVYWNLGHRIAPGFVISVGLGLLFYYIGILCEHTKRNWFIGIRTPWTLSSDKVWEKTNKLGGILLKITGMITFVGILFQTMMLYFILVPFGVTVVVVVFYSYVEFKRELNERAL